MNPSPDIASFLQQHNIPFDWFDHEAVFTCEESSKLPPMPGADTKNLFLQEEKADHFFLVSVGHDKRVDLKMLRNVLGTRPLSFGSAEMLQKHLGVTPGSVTLLGLINDSEHCVKCIIDQSLWDASAVRCHPLVNTASVVLPHEGLVRFLELTNHEPQVMEVPGRA